MISIEKFLQEVKDAEDINECVKSHIVTDYVNYEKKMDTCKMIIELSMYTVIDNKRIFKVKRAVKHELFRMELLRLYTDIAASVGGKESVELYNTLEKNGLWDVILNNLPGNEYKIFNEIMDMYIADEFDNNRNIVSMLEKKSDAINLGLETITKVLEEKGND